MKKVILFLSILIALQGNSQTLKDALFGGKLKTDSNTVLRKGEDLSSKIDSNRKKPVEPEQPPRWLTIREAALYVGRTPQAVHRLIRDGVIGAAPDSSSARRRSWH